MGTSEISSFLAAVNARRTRHLATTRDSIRLGIALGEGDALGLALSEGDALGDAVGELDALGLDVADADAVGDALLVSLSRG